MKHKPHTIQSAKHEIDEMILDMMRDPRSRGWAERSSVLKYDKDLFGLLELLGEVREVWEARA